MSDQVKIVPAVCTQCGGELEVDPSQEKAVCPFCGTSFIVEKAIQNYTVQHATIEHADNVKIDMTGSVKTFFDFAGKQMSESREARKERHKQDADTQKAFFGGFFKIVLVMFILGFVTFFLMNIFNIGGGDENTTSQTSSQYVTEEETEDKDEANTGTGMSWHVDFNF